MSVAKLVAAGHTVTFSQQGSYITQDKTGERIDLVENNGMFLMRLWVPAAGF